MELISELINPLQFSHQGIRCWLKFITILKFTVVTVYEFITFGCH